MVQRDPEGSGRVQAYKWVQRDPEGSGGVERGPEG